MLGMVTFADALLVQVRFCFLQYCLTPLHPLCYPSFDFRPPSRFRFLTKAVCILGFFLLQKYSYLKLLCFF